MKWKMHSDHWAFVSFFFEAKLPLVGRRLGRKGGNVEEKKALGTKMRSFCSTQLFFGKWENLRNKEEPMELFENQAIWLAASSVFSQRWCHRVCCCSRAPSTWMNECSLFPFSRGVDCHAARRKYFVKLAIRFLLFSVQHVNSLVGPVDGRFQCKSRRKIHFHVDFSSCISIQITSLSVWNCTRNRKWVLIFGAMYPPDDRSANRDNWNFV